MARKHSKTALADWFKSKMPSREEMARNKYLAPMAHRFLSPELWRFTRRSVPRGVALGLCCGFIVPIGQIFLAAFMALPARANVPLSALVTFVTNPFTFPLWVVVANKVGRLVLNLEAAIGGSTGGTLADDMGPLAIFFQTAGVTAFGFVVLAVVTAAVGYLVSGFLWRFVVARKRAKRLEAMEMRLNERLGTSEQ